MLAAAPTWAGTVPTWIILALGLLVAYRVSRGGGGSAVTELSKANEVLEHRIHELGSEVRDLRIENEGLKARTDFASALSPVLEGLASSGQASEVRQVAIMEAQASHEERAQERHLRLLNIIDMIAQRLGGEPDGH